MTKNKFEKIRNLYLLEYKRLDYIKAKGYQEISLTSDQSKIRKRVVERYKKEAYPRLVKRMAFANFFIFLVYLIIYVLKY